MAKSTFYKVHTLPGKSLGKSGIFNKLTKGKKRKQLVASVIGVYVLVGGLVGWVLFNNNSNSAKASESALISASIKLDEEKEYNLGDTIKIGMTLQNTSVSESINNISIDVSSTKDSIKWSAIKSNSVTSSTTTISPTGSITLPLISSGERVQYEISGSIQNNQLDFTTIQGKLKYLNRDGIQEGETNRVRLNTKVSSNTKLFTLKSNKATYPLNEEITLDLQAQPNTKAEGKIYISNRKTGELVNTFECVLTDSTTCQSKFKNLPVGDYSALFIDKNEDVFSNIIWLSVTGKVSDFTPSSQSSLEFPAGVASINGILPIVAKKVISLNQTPDTNTVCSFEIYFGKDLINTAKVTADIDRSCKTSLTSDMLNKGDGIYKIKLANTSLEKEISYLNKSASLINLQNKSTILEKGKNVEIAATGILGADAQPLNDKKVTLGIYHVATGEYNDVTTLNGETLKVLNGNFNAVITPTYLNKGGFYLVYTKVEDGQLSDWLALDFEDKQIAFSGTGVLYDSSTLRVGQNINLSLENLIDRNGNIVDAGDCGANIYTTSSAAPISIKGQIKKGICSAILPAGKITKAGPALVTFTGADIVNKINQSKQINILPAAAEKFGQLNLEFTPAKKDFANTLTIGPVTDKFGNLSDALDYKLIMADQNEVLREQKVNIDHGFVQVPVPSTFFNENPITITLKNQKDEQILTKTFEVDKNDSKYVYANLPAEVASDKNIVAKVEGLSITNQTECKLNLIKSQDEISEIKSTYDNEKATCSLDWDLNQNRSADRVLLQLSVGDRVFTRVTNLKSSDPTNLFIITPQIRITPESELAITLLTSPITDKQGKAVTTGNLKWQYNGKVVQNEITDGLSKLSLPANKLETKDIQVSTTSRTLDLDLDVKAGITSISKTNNLPIYIGNYDIANSDFNFVPLSTSTEVALEFDKIFQFTTDTCRGKLLNTSVAATILKTHSQAGICYVQAEAKSGDNTISFENAGFTVGTFAYTSHNYPQEIVWCSTSSNSDKCMIQVKAALNSKIEAIVKDGDKQYKFTSGELDNTVIISQNGLNPLKKYQVEVRYTDEENDVVVQTRQIIGERLIK